MKKLGIGLFLLIPAVVFAVASFWHSGDPVVVQVADVTPVIEKVAVAPKPPAKPKTCEERQDGLASASLKGHNIWPYLCDHREDIHTVADGETFAKILSDRGVSAKQTFMATNEMRRFWDPRDLKADQQISFLYPLTGKNELQGLYILSDPTNLILLKKIDDNFTVESIKVPSSMVMVYKESRITSSLFDAANDSGVPTNILIDMIRAFSYDVDFQRDVKEGNTFSVFYETIQDKNKKILSTGKIAFASMRLNDKFLRIYSHTMRDGTTAFYFRDGVSTRKALLKTPVDGVRISSTFGMRNHPILGYSKMHKGIDFAAPRGTPIRAAGDGKIIKMSPFGAYGNYLRIQHNGSFSTAYAHIDRFAKGLKIGQNVKQGQLVAYIGTTGRSTGPHLHYEILKNNEQINPQGVKLPTSQKLSGDEMKRFRQNLAKIEMQLAALGKNTGSAQLVENRR